MKRNQADSEGCPPDPDPTPSEELAAALIWTILTAVLIIIMITAL